MVHLVVLACVVRATTEKCQVFFEEKSAKKSSLRLWICPPLERLLRVPMATVTSRVARP